MPLAVGAKLGPYEIIAAIGKGGMGKQSRFMAVPFFRVSGKLTKGRVLFHFGNL